MTESIIRLDDVWKIYSLGKAKVNALQGLSIDIKHGEFLSIMGPSGSGKSTAVNMVGSLDIPSKGTIYLEGKDISKLSESDLAQLRGKKIGFIFQQFNLIPTLTALQNITLPMMFQGINENERVKRGMELLEKVDLKDRMHHKPNELSGGQQQRVAIARSLSNDPDVILADEPTGNLDSKTGISVMSFLKELNRKDGKTIIMVTHDNHLAKYADRTVYLKDGKITRKL
tara:strand:+ start:326 stop:1009 length:684 start_codon:yes stop_codon:yes gene_type:complete